MDLFFYGTLRHQPLLECVLGRTATGLDLSEAQLPGHAVHAVRDQIFPMIETRSGSIARGLLVRGLSETDLDRLAFYEGGFDYDLSPVTVSVAEDPGVAAQVFFPRPGLWQAGPLWSLEDWAAEWGPLTVRAAVEVMEGYGRRAPAQIAASFPAIRRRAASWVSAQARPGDPDRDMARDVQVLRHDHAYSGFFAVEEMDLRFRRYDGSLSAAVSRAALIVGEAAVVLPYDPVRDVVLLTEQFRAPVYMAGDHAPWIWEPVAGLVDPGESAVEAAHREVMEEAGLTLDRLEPAGQMYSSTGSSGEYLHLFIGLADISDAETAGGVADEGEDILSRVFSYDALMKGVDEQRFRDMPLVATALWLARHRDRLRGTAGGA